MTPGDDISNRERPFSIEELFFSTTDARGFIQAGNEVFVHVSGFSRDELIGRPHNIIRHPHTPRVVFRLLWEYLEADRPIAAYVKNRAKDGSHYWVLAAARPIEGGYLSVRLKPSTPWFEAVQSIYAELHELETGIERAGGSRREAMDASGPLLQTRLAEAGFADYGSFMRTALASEVMARRDAMGHGIESSQGTDLGVAEITRRLGERLSDELDSIDGYVSLNQTLAERSAALVRLAEEGQVLALNAVLASRRLGSDGGPLIAVAGLMQQTFPSVVESARSVVSQIQRTRNALQHVGFAVGLAVLQHEMAITFLDEVGRAEHPREALANLDLLIHHLRADVHDTIDTIGVIADGIDQIGQSARMLQADLAQLTAIERNGRIEATRTVGAESFASLLENTRLRVANAQTQIRQVAVLASQFDLIHVRSMQRSLASDLDELQHAIENGMLTARV